MPIRIRHWRTEIEIPDASREVVTEVVRALLGGEGRRSLPRPRREINLEEYLPEGESVIFDGEGGFNLG